MNTKVLEGKLTISRPTGGEVEYISISLVDGTSRNSIVDIRVGLEDFTKALTGQGYMPCNIEYFPQENVGKVAEFKTEFVPFEVEYGKETSYINKRKDLALRPFEVDGWKGHRDCLGNWQVSGEKDGIKGYKVGFTRYIDKK